ncbi:MAG: hypothetical protein EXX96DRAFT_357301 [Benjaminiella poitrasii]|nr:MAG: hypothetical protein EXX96DRAFT_357301 [Benjaminiella poitrasii]
MMGYDNIGLTVSREEAERLEAENARRLLKSRKLSLIIDLDQTIVHATTSQQYVPSSLEELEKNDIRQFKLPGSEITYYVKLRLGLDEFLKEIDSLYELHIYTMGTRDYAEAITKEIDSKGDIFKERILSRNESGSVTQKKLQRLFPCDTSMVVVLDDRWDVWNFAPNLIRIKPYEFFVGIDDRHYESTNTTATENKHSYLAIKQDTKDNELYTMLKILKQIHQAFYSKPIEDKSTDVTRIIPDMKQQVLKDTIITFSDRILPQQDITHSDPSLSWIWQMASAYGAHCSIDLTGKTTHLIAIPATSRNKVKAARRYGHPNLHVVTPGWLFDSTARWSIQPEDNYALPELKNSDNEEYQDEDDMTEDPNDEAAEDDSDEDLVKDINWDEANKEVEDFINESGIDDVWGDTDSENIIESPYSSNPTSRTSTSLSTTSNASHLKKRKRIVASAVESGGDSGGDSGGEDGSDEDDKTIMSSLAKRRLKVKKRGKSQLSKVVTISSAASSQSGNASDNEDSGSSSSSSASLDEFADILDEVLE